MPTSMMHQSIDQGWNRSPLDKGQIDVGTDNIKVRLIGFPSDEHMFRQCIAKMIVATTGHDVGKELDPLLAEELFRGGLQTGLEVFSFVFEISGVSRQLTHELVRTRKAVFHQQSMRHTNMGDMFNVRMPISMIDGTKKIPLANYYRLAKAMGLSGVDTADPSEIFKLVTDITRQAYAALKDADLPYQDCRMVCPIATETYIIASYPIGEWLSVYSYRACSMFLWEMQHVMHLMKLEVVARFPWMYQYIKIGCEKSKRCVYQGLEDTSHDCSFEWRNDRVYKPNLEMIGLKGKAYSQKGG